MNLNYLSLPLIALSSISVLDAATLFTDDFDDRATIGSGTATTGWTVSDNSRVYVSSAESESGANSLFFRDGSSRRAELTSFVTITDVSQDLLFSFDYFGAASFEASDGLLFQVDFGSGFESVLLDQGMLDGYTSADTAYTGTQITLANGSGTSLDFVSYSVIVPSSYYSDTLSATEFKLKFVFNGSNDDEDAYIDNINVATVPEPSQFAAVLGLTGLLLTLRRRRS